MKMTAKAAGWMLVVLLILCYCRADAANEEKDESAKLTQGELAMSVIKHARLRGLLPEAATASDAIELLESLGVEPEGGWDSTKEVSKEELESMVRNVLGPGKPLPDTMEMLIEKLARYLADILWMQAGTLSPASPVLP
jgi:hypothetical protein